MPKKSKTATPTPVVMVTGDVVVDHHIYVAEWATEFGPRSIGPTRHHAEFGGAAIIEHLLTPVKDEKTLMPLRVVLDLAKDATLYPHCYATWAPSAPPREGEAASWRVRYELGCGEACSAWPAEHGPSSGSRAKGAHALRRSRRPSITPDILTIDDSGRGFRDSSELWPACLSSSRAAPSWVIWKMSNELRGGALWEHIASSAVIRRRLILLISAADLRRAGHPVSRGLSWERTALDTARLLTTAAAGPLARSQHVVVSYQGAGALWLDRSGERPRATLVYDPRGTEADPDELSRGKVYGFQACFAAGIAWGLAVAMKGQAASNRSAILDGVRRGLNARRELQHHGHGPVHEKRPPDGFPARRIRENALVDPPQLFARVEVPDHVDHEEWTILSDSAGASGGSGPLYAEARLVALNGLSALAGMPSLEVGAFATVDRREIESLRRIRDLYFKYESITPQAKPLSLAVFGAPGSGKSFIVRELARWLLGKKPPLLEVNLSQFYDERELIGAFHRVRDLVLKGRTPLVFWDEFDAQEYRWLRLLLAPMQDGSFQEGQIVHPIGKCVFVFAGGTSTSFEAFKSRSALVGAERTRDAHDWKFAKGPDFVSRIHGSLDVLGPNQRRIEATRPGTSPGLDPTDVCFPIRRAFFMRGVLGARDSARLDIEIPLLDALLRVPDYTHGSRSFDRILGRLRRGGPHFDRRALLPLEDLASDITGESVLPDLDGRVS